MGNHKNITFDKFPKQGNELGKRVNVCFHYNIDQQLKGTVVRDDREEPFRCIIKLDNDLYIDTCECQYSLDLSSDNELIKTE